MEFRLLGPVEVLEQGASLPLGGRRQRAVLTHLLLSRNVALPGDVLIEQVWGETPPAAVRASLHTYVSRLRALLGPTRLETTSQGYVLHADCSEVDVARFESMLAKARSAAESDPEQAAAAYDQALALWRGPALGDLAGELSLRLLAAHLEALRESVVEERIGVRLAGGHHAELLPELEDLLRRDSLREDLWSHYALALYRCGRQGDALAALSKSQRILRDELGLEPSQDLRRLHERVLHQDEGLTLSGSGLHGYRLLEVLGEGSSSVVHRAVQPSVGREVAVKVLRRSRADDPRLAQRFAVDAQTAAGVGHPHVIPVYDFWRAPGSAYLVLRLLRGGSAADLAASGALRVEELLRLIDQVAGALDACHRQGVVHHELAPWDVLLDEDGNAYVSPFVLTRDLARGTPRVPVGTGAALGRPAPAPGRPDVAALCRLLGALAAAVPAPPAALTSFVEVAAATAWPDAQTVSTALRTAVAPTVPLPRQAARSPGVRPRNPYKGLRAFTEADAPDFFGREPLVRRLVQRLSEQVRFLAVVGPSGSGKSSVVRAGLIPALRHGAVGGVDRWYVADFVPTEDPLNELATALRRVAVMPLPADAVSRLRSDPASLTRLADELLPDDVLGERSELLLLVDQLEELFTLTPEPDRRAFLELLVVAATRPSSRIRVLVTLRADFYDRPLDQAALGELLRAGTEVVLPLTAEELERAVVEPAEQVGLRVEPALLARVVADVGSAPGCLPLLQFALTELAERTSGDTLSVAGYLEIGGVSGALVRRADGVHAGFTPQQQSIARQVLLALVQPGEAHTVTRRRVLRAELVQRTDDPETAHTVIESLGAARLLEFDRDPATRAPTVQVAHEALLREWGLLRRLAEAARDDLRTSQRLAAAAREWDETGRDPSFLATGSRLDAISHAAARWSSATAWTPTALERDYLAESQRVRKQAEREEQARQDWDRELERRSVRRLRAVAAVLAIAVIAASGLTAFGFSQRNRAERESLVAEARALSAASVASLEEDPERAVLLALKAVSTREPDGKVLPQAEEALHRAVVASRVALTLTGVGGALDWSARGLIVSEGPEGTGLIDLRDAATGRSVRTFPGHAVDVNDVAFSPDGLRLLTTGDDGAARLWDPATGRLVRELRTRGQVWGPSFSGDGRRMAAAWQGEGVVRVIDVATGAVLATLRGVREPAATTLDRSGSRVALAGGPAPGAVVHDVASGARVLHVDRDGDPAYDVDFSPDGRWLVTSGVDGRARLWSSEDGSAQGTLYTSAPVAELDWSPDSSRAVVGGDDGVARVYSVTAEGTREDMRLSSSALRGIRGVAFSPDGRRVVLGGTPTDVAQVWEVSPAGSREWLTSGVPGVHSPGADFASDGRHVLAGTADGRLAVLDESGRITRVSPRAYAGSVGLLRSSPDGALVAGFVEGAARVWSAGTGAEVLAVPVGGTPLGLAWSGDGRLLGITASGAPLKLVDRGGAPVPVPAPMQRDVITAVAFSRDADVMVTAHRPGSRGTGHVDVRDRSRERLTRRWVTDTDTTALVLDPAGRRVATALSNGDVALWDIDSGRQIATLVGHVGPVWDLAFSDDGGTLATAGQDATVRLWDLGSGQERLMLRGHESVVMTVRFSPEGDRLVTTSGDETIRVWALALDDLVRLASARLTRELSDAECRRYLQRSC